MSVESSPKLPEVIDPTVAADCVRSQREPLLNLISHCLSSLANSLLAKFIIPRDVYKKACNQSFEDNDRGGALLDCVETRIQLNSSYFATFIDILKSEPFLSEQSEKLIQSYYTLSSLPINRHPATTSPAISQYADELKKAYRKSRVSPVRKWPPTPSKKYINLATVEHDQYACREEILRHTLHGNIREMLKTRKKISVDEILLPADEEDVTYLKLVLVEGAPGMGKSTLAWELCRKWEQGHMEIYTLTVLLRLREKRVQEVISISELFYSCPSNYKDALINEVSSSSGKGVLFILDGFDELPTTLQNEGFLVDLISGTFLPECTVLVTSRPSATAELLTIGRPLIDKHIEILGFTQESVEEYVTSIFSSEPERLQKFKAFISASENPAINSLMYVPLNAAIIVEIYRHSKSDHFLPRTLTQLYIQLCLTILNRYLQSNSPSARVNKFKDLPSDLNEEFLKLSKVAFDGMRSADVIFHNLPSNLVHFGFLDAVSSLYGGGDVSYNFLHLTLQEFFAAYHISQFTGEARLAFFEECGSSEYWNVVLRFVAGLTKFKFFEGHFDIGLFKDGVDVRLLFIQCLFEADMKIDGSEVGGFHNITIDWMWSTLDLYELGYCIANLTNELSWNVQINKISSLAGLNSGLNTNNSISNNNNISKLSIWTSRSLSFSEEGLHLGHFPLCGITELTICSCYLTSSFLTYLSRFIPSMTSLTKVDISHNTFEDKQCADKFLQQLSQTSVTSLDVRSTYLTEFPSVLQPLIDPLTGTLEELCIGGFLQTESSSVRHKYPHKYDDALLFDTVCVPSSLKSLKLVHPHKISSLTKLETNTHLKKLEIIKSCDYHPLPSSRLDPASELLFHRENNISRKLVEVIVRILEHNKTLKHLILIGFNLPYDIVALRDIIKMLHRNSTLRSVCLEMGIDDPEFDEFKSLFDYIKTHYPELSDPRISLSPQIFINTVRNWLQQDTKRNVFDRVVFSSKANLALVKGFMHNSFPLFPSANRDSFTDSQNGKEPVENGDDTGHEESGIETGHVQNGIEIGHMQNGIETEHTQKVKETKKLQNGNEPIQNETKTPQDGTETQQNGTETQQNGTETHQNGTGTHQNGVGSTTEACDGNDSEAKEETNGDEEEQDDEDTEALLQSLQELQDANMKSFEEIVRKLGGTATRSGKLCEEVSSPTSVLSQSVPSGELLQSLTETDFTSSSPFGHDRKLSGDMILNPSRTESDV